MVLEIIKYTPWSNRLVSKNFGHRFTSSKIPFAMLKSLQLNNCEELEDIASLVNCTTFDRQALSILVNLQIESP